MNSNKWKVDHTCKQIDSDIIIDEDVLQIQLRKSIYSYGKALMFFGDIKGKYVYQIHLSLQTENAETKILYTLRNRQKEELVRGYLKDGDCFVTTEATCFAEISVLAFSKGQAGFVQVRDVQLCCTGPYKPRNVTLAAVGINYNEDLPRTFEKNMQQNLQAIDHIMADQKADLIVMTECVYSRRVRGYTSQECALTLEDEPIRKFRQKAREYGTYLVFSILEKRNKRLYNTAVLIDRQGEIAGTYHKTHLTIDEYEAGYTPGDEVPVFQTDFGTIGIGICWDLFFPEHVKTYHLKGVDILCYPTAGFFEPRACMRAYDNGTYLIVSGVQAKNHSRIVNPLGEILDEASKKDYAAAVIDLNQPVYQRWLSCESYACGKDIYRNERRSDLYKKYNS